MDRLRLVIFDVDGTLVDSQAHIVGAMEAATAGLGVETPARGEILSIVGLSLPEAMAQLFPGEAEARRTRLVAAYKEAFAALRAEDASPLYPGARAALDRLAAEEFTLLGIATGKSRRGLSYLMEAHDLGRYFVTRQTADDHPSKPHPSMIETALAETGVEAADAAMIGDTSFDMAMARAAGVAGIGVAWGYHPAEALHTAGARAVVEDYEGLMAEIAQREALEG